MKTTVLGVAYDNITMAEALERGRELLAGSETAYCVTPNAEMAYEAMKDPEFRGVPGAAGRRGRDPRREDRPHAAEGKGGRH